MGTVDAWVWWLDRRRRPGHSAGDHRDARVRDVRGRRGSRQPPRRRSAAGGVAQVVVFAVVSVALVVGRPARRRPARRLPARAAQRCRRAEGPSGRGAGTGRRHAAAGSSSAARSGRPAPSTRTGCSSQASRSTSSRSKGRPRSSCDGLITGLRGNRRSQGASTGRSVRLDHPDRQTDQLSIATRRVAWGVVVTPIIIVLIILVVLVFIALIKTIQVIPQASAAIVERFGRYTRTLSAGLNIVVPFIDTDPQPDRPARTGRPVPAAAGDHPGQPGRQHRHRHLLPGHRRPGRDLRGRQLHPGDRAADRHHAAQHHRRHGPGAHPDLPRGDQRRACAASSTRPPASGASASTASS